ncbi:MAG: hypothetical protein Q9204_000109 [Flavoplaca sp. TL-2023a]
MPQLRDVTVHVTDADGNDLDEWGVQSLRGNKVSAYIKSTTDMPFRVSIQPKIPYFDEEITPGASCHTHGRVASDNVYIKMEESSDDLVGQPSSSQCPFNRRRPRCGAEPPKSWRRHHKSRRSSSSLGRSGGGALENTWAPFSFVAALYLDGRKKPERKVVVYLDPTDEDFNPPNGLVKFKCRTVQARDGVLKEKAWVFRDIGIETIFDKIALRENARDTIELEDVLVDAMNTSRLGDDVVANEENDKIGQIVVELERVKLGKKYKERDYRPKHMEGDRDDIDMGGVGSHVVHTTGFEHLRSLEQRPVRCVEFEPLVRGERPWATFQFFYRSHEQLQKFNFLGYPQDLQWKSPQQRQPLGTRLANLTPLSIAHPKYKTPVFTKPEELSFETRVKEGSHDPTKIAKAEYGFDDYRDPHNEASSPLRQVHGKDGKRSISAQAAPDMNGRSSVVAVKEKTRIRPSHPKFTPGPRKLSLSSVSSLSLCEFLPSSPTGSPTRHPPANSPTAGSFHASADGQPIHRGSDFDILQTLSSASLALTKAKSSEANDQLRPRSSIGNRDTFRGETNSSSEAEADDEKDGDGESEEGSWESVDVDDEEERFKESDKENQPSPADNDAATLHEDFKRVTIGSKRQRGQGMEELEDGEIAEEDELATSMDLGRRKKKKSTSPVYSNLSSPLQAVEGKKEQQAKRVKMVETPATVDGQSTLQAQSEQPVVWTMTMEDNHVADVVV